MADSTIPPPRAFPLVEPLFTGEGIALWLAILTAFPGILKGLGGVTAEDRLGQNARLLATNLMAEVKGKRTATTPITILKRTSFDIEQGLPGAMATVVDSLTIVAYHAATRQSLHIHQKWSQQFSDFLNHYAKRHQVVDLGAPMSHAQRTHRFGLKITTGLNQYKMPAPGGPKAFWRAITQAETLELLNLPVPRAVSQIIEVIQTSVPWKPIARAYIAAGRKLLS